jgi:predicted N-acetyltransferase YhbS
MLRFLRRLIRASHPFDANKLGERAGDIAFRVMEDDDITTCLSFYRANEAAHFPPGRFDYFAEKLRRREFLTLLAMRDQKPVGCCGISYDVARNGGGQAGVLCFGMVDPAHQRRGIGTAQLLVRIASLTPVNDLVYAVMFAVPNSVSFYRRFGFDFNHEAAADDGATYPLGILKVSQSLIEDCRDVLARRNVTYPDVRDKIPKRQVQEYSGPYCVSCRAPVKLNIRICPLCGWTQPL